jgi:hypothetical protein
MAATVMTMMWLVIAQQMQTHVVVGTILASHKLFSIAEVHKPQVVLVCALGKCRVACS